MSRSPETAARLALETRIDQHDAKENGEYRGNRRIYDDKVRRWTTQIGTGLRGSLTADL